jgi:hypothetical protein
MAIRWGLGAAFIRMDVPGVNGEVPYSKLFGSSAVYSITPVSEGVTRAAVVSVATRPLGMWTTSVLRALPPTIDGDEFQNAICAVVNQILSFESEGLTERVFCATLAGGLFETTNRKSFSQAGVRAPRPGAFFSCNITLV